MRSEEEIRERIDYIKSFLTHDIDTIGLEMKLSELEWVLNEQKEGKL